MLGHILTEGHVFDEIETEEDRIAHNLAIRLLYRCGIIAQENIGDLIDAIVSISLKDSQFPKIMEELTHGSA